MKNKFHLTLLILFLGYSTFSQELLNEHEISLNQAATNEPFSIVDLENNSHLFFITNAVITHLKYDSDYNLVLEKKYSRPPAPFKEIVGYSIGEENSMHLYFSNKKIDKFYLKTLLPDGTTKNEEFEFKIKKEYFVQFLNHQNKFYVLTTPKGSSSINLYNFYGNSFTITSYDLSNERFYGIDNKSIQLSSLLFDKTIEIIEGAIPSAIEITSKPFKIYPKENEFILTLDHRDSATRVIRLNFRNGTHNVSHYTISTLNFQNLNYLKSNSFLFRNRVYQLISSRDRLVFTIKDGVTKKVLQEYTVQKDDEEITFKNSPIFQDGSMYSSGIRELNKTKQFLRKITNSNIGIAAFEKEGLIHLHLGGIREMNSGGAPMMMPGFGGIPIASAGVFTFSLNPTFYAFNSYQQTQSIYIKCLFDANNFEHLPGPVLPNTFDEITKYTDGLERVGLETVFKMNDFFIYGYYNKKNKLYRLLRFE